ncbi:hypothetical protein TRVL_06171 [Trypanosoma vivax]|nr:hypothetical protein TRVL_06171 [Trypanosoma vivax]
MIRTTSLKMKIPKRRGPYVQKFLEGCPTCTTLVDDIAGANLKSSLPFFSTTPRYIVAAESRLSKLFFHHVLYPAGGARRPYRVVIVRGGRGVRVHSVERGTVSYLGCRVSELSRHVVSRDPVRRTFFYGGSTVKENSANITGRNKCYASETSDISSIRQPPVDNLLSLLCGVVEGHFMNLRAPAVAQHDSAPRETESERNENISWSLATLLSCGHGGLLCERRKHFPDANSPLSVVKRLLGVAAHISSSFFYVQTQLPASAIFLTRASTKPVSLHARSPLENLPGLDRMEASECFVAQLAGGLEPVVSFAVGTPQTVHRFGPSLGSCSSGIETKLPKEKIPFGHIQCLLRVNTRGRTGVGRSGSITSEPVGLARIANDPPSASSVDLHMHVAPRHCGPVDNVKFPQRVVHERNSNGIEEPCKLGTSLDCKTPFIVRTVSEKLAIFNGGFASGHKALRNIGGAVDTAMSMGSCLNLQLVRDDCETYLLPQRELLFSFYAPAEVVAMCTEQNEERMRRQAALSHVNSPYFPTDGPRTAAQALRAGYVNHVATETVENRNAENGQLREAGGTPVYEVRALPGDVVYIPRGWSYNVRRMLGAAIVTTDTASCTFNGAAEGGIVSTANGQPAVGKNVRYVGKYDSYCGRSSEVNESDVGLAEIVAVEVDAFLLCYNPYPVLSPTQAAVYVAANYVHSGVDEFYAKGGNNVHHNYR